MAKQHLVVEGECLSSIAKSYGFGNYGSVYDHPGNAALKRRRPNPNTLMPGDQVYIPDVEERVVSCATGQLHRFVLRSRRVMLELAVRHDDEPVADADYTLEVGEETYSGKTDSQGLLRHAIGGEATRGRLCFAKPPLEIELELGSLPPITEVSGVQARLNNLGFACGKVDGDVGPRTRSALRRFQSQNDLPVTGAVDETTRVCLRQQHDGG